MSSKDDKRRSSRLIDLSIEILFIFVLSSLLTNAPEPISSPICSTKVLMYVPFEHLLLETYVLNLIFLI